MAGPGSQSAFAFKGDDLDFARPCPLQPERLSDRGRQAMAGGAGIPFQEQRLSLHLGVARKSAPTTKAGEVLLKYGMPGVEPILGIASLLMLDAQRLGKDCQCRVDQRYAVSGAEDEAVTESLLRMPNVPAELTAEQQGDEGVDF